MTELLVPPPPPPMATEMSDDTVENTNGEGLTEERNGFKRRKKTTQGYNRIYMGHLSDEEDSSMDTDDTGYTYFG